MRAWAPSWRLRSIRSSSAAWVWVRSARIEFSRATCSSALAFGLGARYRDTTGERVLQANGPAATLATANSVTHSIDWAVAA